MFWIILVRTGKTWSFECGDWNKDYARLLADNTTAIEGDRKRVHFCCVDDDSLERIQEAVNAKNSLERF